MAGSGFGVNRVGKNGGILLLSIPIAGPAYSTPYTGYGVIGANDSGPIMWEAAGAKSWTIQIIGGGAASAGYSVSIYYTIDPVLLANMSSNSQGAGPQYTTNDYGIFDPVTLSKIVPASSWVLAPLQAATGGGPEANPFVTGTNWGGFMNGGAIAIRAVLTTLGSPSAGCQVLCMAIP